MSQVGNPITRPDMDNQKFIFFSKEALEAFEKEDPQVRKIAMQIIETTRWRPTALVVGGNLAPLLFALIPVLC